MENINGDEPPPHVWKIPIASRYFHSDTLPNFMLVFFFVDTHDCWWNTKTAFDETFSLVNTLIALAIEISGRFGWFSSSWFLLWSLYSMWSNCVRILLLWSYAKLSVLHSNMTVLCLWLTALLMLVTIWSKVFERHKRGRRSSLTVPCNASPMDPLAFAGNHNQQKSWTLWRLRGAKTS